MEDNDNTKVYTKVQATKLVMEMVMMEEEEEGPKAYVVYCSTGCSCCSDENHYRGPFSTREIAEARCELYTKTRLLASQYARNGNYKIEEYDAELLPGGRVIVDDTVFAGWAEDTGEDYIDRNWG